MALGRAQAWRGAWPRRHGAKIKLGEDGKLRVADPALRKEILDLRRDPAIAAAMAAEHAADNQQRLEAKLDRDVQPTDLYLAHFLGLKGATSFLGAMEKDAKQGAADLFPKAAAANKSIFYRADGSQRTLQEIYDRFESRMVSEMAAYDDLEGASFAGETMLADVRSSRGNAGGVSGDGAIFGQTSPGGVLSPFMLVTLAALPTGRDRDEAMRRAQQPVQPRHHRQPDGVARRSLSDALSIRHGRTWSDHPQVFRAANAQLATSKLVDGRAKSRP